MLHQINIWQTFQIMSWFSPQEPGYYLFNAVCINYYYHIIYMERDVDACIILGHGNSEVLTPVPFHSSASKHDMPNLKMKQNKTV